MKRITISPISGAKAQKRRLLIKNMSEETAHFLSRWFVFAQRERCSEETYRALLSHTLSHRSIIYGVSSIIESPYAYDDITIIDTEGDFAELPSAPEGWYVMSNLLPVYIKVSEGVRKWVASIRTGDGILVTHLVPDDISRQVLWSLFGALEKRGFLRPIVDGDPSEMKPAIGPWFAHYERYRDVGFCSDRSDLIVEAQPYTLITGCRLLVRGTKEYVLPEWALPDLKWQGDGAVTHEEVQEANSISVWAERPDGTKEWLLSVNQEHQIAFVPYHPSNIEYCNYWMSHLFSYLESIGVLREVGS